MISQLAEELAESTKALTFQCLTQRTQNLVLEPPSTLPYHPIAIIVLAFYSLGVGVSSEPLLMMHIVEMFPSFLSGPKQLELSKSLRTFVNLFKPYFDGKRVPEPIEYPNCGELKRWNCEIASRRYLLNFDYIVSNSKVFKQETFDPNFICSIYPILYNPSYNLSKLSPHQILGLLSGIPPNCVFI